MLSSLIVYSTTEHFTLIISIFLGGFISFQRIVLYKFILCYFTIAYMVHSTKNKIAKNTDKQGQKVFWSPSASAKPSET